MPGTWGPSLSCPPLSLCWARTRGASARIPAQSAATRNRSLILGGRNSQPGPPLSLGPRGPGGSEPDAPHLPVLVLPAGSPAPAASRRRSPGVSSREKSLIPGGGAAGGDPGARLHPPSQRSPPPPPLPWTEDPTPLKCKAPHLLWPLRIPQKVLC